MFNRKTIDRGISVNNAQMQRAELPRVIFFEDHRDTSALEVMTHILGDFNKLGYLTFLSEMPKGTTLEMQVSEAEDGAEAYESLKKLMASQNLDINKKSDLQKFAKGKLTDEQIEDIETTQRMVASYAYGLAFYKRLKQSDIQYKAIDLENVLQIAKQAGVNTLTPARDKLFAHEYTNNSFCFGQHGHKHAIGIQKEVLLNSSTLSIEELQNKFLFVHVYSQQDCAIADSHFPLGMLKFNKNDNTLNEIKNVILKEIQKRIQWLVNFSSELTQKNEDSSAIDHCVKKKMRVDLLIKAAHLIPFVNSEKPFTASQLGYFSKTNIQSTSQSSPRKQEAASKKFEGLKKGFLN